MRRIAAVYLPIAILAAALVLGGLKLASEVFAQSEEASYDDGWLVLNFTSIVFEDGLWLPATRSLGCTFFGSRPEEDHPASVRVFNGSNVVTRTYDGVGAKVEVCDLIVSLPPISAGLIVTSEE